MGFRGPKGDPGNQGVVGDKGNQGPPVSDIHDARVN